MRFLSVFQESKNSGTTIEVPGHDLIDLFNSAVAPLKGDKTQTRSVLFAKLFSDRSLQKYRESLIHLANSDYHIGKAAKALGLSDVDKKSASKFAALVSTKFSECYKECGDAGKETFNKNLKEYLENKSKQIKMDI
jgi:hypothetical protein